MRAALLFLPLLALLTACGDDDMSRQSSLRTYEETPLWPNGTEARPFPAGTVARGSLAYAQAVASPPPVDPGLLEEGQRSFRTFCVPCHGLAGDGDGIVVQRGFSPPPSYHSARLRAAPGSHFVDVITNGYGAMYSFADRVSPRERWAIAAYIRALQTSRQTQLAQVPDAAGKLP